MPSSLRSLASAPPSGAARPLLVDPDAYATAVLRQGAPIPWGDLAALTGHAGQVHSLLDPDAVWVDVEALLRARLATEPAAVAAMRERSRTGYALRSLLGDKSGADLVRTAVRTLSDATRRPAVLAVPSPARWLGRAHALAGTPLTDVDEDHADSASMYIAEWLGKLGSLPVALVLLDATAAGDDPATTVTETLGAYTSLTNVVSHFEWAIALRDGDAVDVPAGEPEIAVVPTAYWTKDTEPPAADVLLTAIPPTATPEDVLDRRARLR
ncbi:hypothetical protein [Streptomyces sp. ITFR-16]|uniref:hypothetical protein n=1 Tax=Streptomyces sp. ITFR-16 TaxID=3075198 RepID=UPI00288B233F|nr:hypothetical protein [Streptomyces sp. ITFR-16]WNI21411.1 hypothetical protein RLT58_05480 [Streptomyces sp. ITFR-16]